MSDTTSETFGRNIDSSSFWEREAGGYRDDLARSRAAYHQGRLATASRLMGLASFPDDAHALDFGCGDGTFTLDLAAQGFSVTGIDIARPMIDLANDAAAPLGLPAEFKVGSVRDLAERSRAVELLVSLNVLAYLTDAEMEVFMREAQRLVARGGWLLLSHSNQLFDLFALNAGTATFFADNLTDGTAVDSLLTCGSQDNATYNVRANPLAYSSELAKWGFREVAQAFFNFHPLPPSLLGPGDEGRIFDPETIASMAPWRQMLQCSTYFSLSQRIDDY